MKCLFFIVLLWFCDSVVGERDSYVQKYDEVTDRDDRNFEDEFEDRIWKERNEGICDKGCDINIVGLDKDDNEDIIRPCSFNDWQCIRKFFADNSKCTPAYGPIPDPLKLERNTINYPFINVTVILTKFRVRGLSSGTVKEFYVNKNTGNLVLALDFKDLNHTAQANFRFKRTRKESIVLSDVATIKFKSGTFTAVIPKVPHLRLDLAEIHADIDDAYPTFSIGPKASSSADPDVIAALTKLVADMPTATQESFLFQSQLFLSIYIQQNICDFELKLISI